MRPQVDVLRATPAGTAEYINTCTSTYNKTRSLATTTKTLHVTCHVIPIKTCYIVKKDKESQRLYDVWEQQRNEIG